MTNENTIRLRAMEPEDLEMLYGIENDRKIWNVGSTNVPYSRYVLHEYIANSSSDIYADKQLRLIVDNSDGTSVGIVDLVNFDPRNNRAEIGVVIADGHRRKGYAFHAISQLADYASRILHIHQLYAFVAVNNTACMSLFSRLHFREVARLPQWLLAEQGYEDAVLFIKQL